MTSRNFNKILKLFDYFKDAYRINTHHKELYRPQVIFILLKGLLVFITSLTFIRIFEDMALLPNLQFDKFFSILWNEFKGLPLMMTLTTMVVLLFGSTFVESGLYHMYYKLTTHDTNNGHFSYGASKYFLRFLGANLLIILFWLLAFIPYLIVGAVTLTAGFVLLPIIVGVFLSVWKVSMVSDNKSISDAIGDSMRFGKKHFIPMSVLLIIRSSLTSMGGGSSSGSSYQYNAANNTGTSTGDLDLPLNNMPNFSGPVESLSDFDPIGFIKIFLIIIASVVSIAIVVSALVHMIFEVFFGLTFTVIYVDDWALEEEVI